MMKGKHVLIFLWCKMQLHVMVTTFFLDAEPYLTVLWLSEHPANKLIQHTAEKHFQEMNSYTTHNDSPLIEIFCNINCYTTLKALKKH